MIRNRAMITVLGIAVLVVALAGYVLFSDTSNDQVPSGSVAVTSDSDFNLGITYLTVTSRVATHYDLGVSSGVLVTEVTSGGHADRAGVKVGDVIVSFNGTMLGQETPLLGMMRGCHAGHTVMLEVWSRDANRTIEFTHAGD